MHATDTDPESPPARAPSSPHSACIRVAHAFVFTQLLPTDRTLAEHVRLVLGRARGAEVMGAYLSEPIKEKESESGNMRNGVRWGCSSMQGWPPIGRRDRARSMRSRVLCDFWRAVWSST